MQIEIIELKVILFAFVYYYYTWRGSFHNTHVEVREKPAEVSSLPCAISTTLRCFLTYQIHRAHTVIAGYTDSQWQSIS